MSCIFLIARVREDMLDIPDRQGGSTVDLADPDGKGKIGTYIEDSGNRST